MATVFQTEREQDGLKAVLTPVQLARIFDGRDMSETEALSTRIWGGVQGVLGVIEIIGAGALIATPEPTMATKVGGGALGAYGIDSAQAGFRQMWTGHRTETATYESTAWLSRELGVDRQTAEKIARGVDIAVPLVLSAGLGAARIAAIRNGRIALIEHEAEAGAKVGGHTIATHVAKTDAKLLERLTTAGRRAPEMVSTFTTLEIAETSIYQTLRVNRQAIVKWLKTAGPGEREAFEAAFGGAGRGIARGTSEAVQLNRVRVVLKKEAFNGKLYYILTAYPVP